MKTIIFFFLFVPTMSQAQNFMRFDDFAQGLTRGFQLQADCERGGFKCFNADLEKLDEQVVELVDVDDLTKPIYSSPTNITPCADWKSCSDLLPTLCQAPSLPFYRQIEGETYEAYCTTVIGYEQKKEPRLKEDNEKKQAKQIRRQEREARRAARQTVEARMARLARQSDLTAAESREVALWLLKQEVNRDE